MKIKLLDKVEKIISEELANFSVNAEWNMNEIHILPGSNTVIECTSSAGSLSQALINHYFPPILDTVKQSHFTSMSKFQSILDSKSLRLYSLLKRVNQQEFKAFTEDFGLTGYLDANDGEPYYKTLMNELFYTSFTNPIPSDETHMWGVFGDGGKGVKLILELSVIQLRSELRPVKYSSKTQAASSLIKQLMKRIYSECDRHFIMRGISRVGAFYLPLGCGLEQEEETRLLIKSSGEGPAHDLIENDGVHRYIPLKLGDGNNQFCKLDLVEVEVKSKSDKDKVTKLLTDAGLWNVKVSLKNP